ncbi:hypothetical protein GYMLUDRAFT_248058 [Collybiopsis luxurians FD-317 M1]|uniref:Uncharacterized protein n=1 Tax=Collybiopsis luxurians FD-317 M1 TaxID=944289 RepID=A0A0D0C1X5_9AGAR|nr:hypothetical protein GYMLUDRAFT_248058 [Collybiopsis luxurians FD-317 M1]
MNLEFKFVPLTSTTRVARETEVLCSISYIVIRVLEREDYTRSLPLLPLRDPFVPSFTILPVPTSGCNTLSVARTVCCKVSGAALPEMSMVEKEHGRASKRTTTVLGLRRKFDRFYGEDPGLAVRREGDEGYKETSQNESNYRILIHTFAS